MVKKALDFRPGKVVETFTASKDGKNIRVRLRYPSISDVDDAMKYINATICECNYLRLNEEISREEEAEWIRDSIEGMKNGTKVVLFAEIEGVIAGSGNADLDQGAASHVATIGVSLREKYTNMGIGTRFMEVLMNEALKIGAEVVKLSYYENNERARHVYEKLGFKHIGVLPRARKSKGKYSDVHLMYRILVK